MTDAAIEVKVLVEKIAETLAWIRATLAELPDFPKLETDLDIEHTPLGDPLPGTLSVYGRVKTLRQLQSGLKLLAMQTGEDLRELRRAFLRLPPELREKILAVDVEPRRERIYMELDLSDDGAPIVKAGGSR